MKAPTDAAVDLLVPYWGEPHYLRETVASVLAQTDPAWRLTVVDDAYPDAWAEAWIEGLGDGRIAYVRNATNRGINAVFQQCVALARADLVAIPGSDDLLLPDFVATARQAHHRFPDVDIIQPGVRVVDGQGRTVRPLADRVKQEVVRPRGAGARVLAGEALMTSLMHGDWLYWPSLVFRREAVQRTPFRPGLPIVLDLALVVDMLAAGSSLLVEPTECFAYRRHDASASSQTAVDGARFEGERDYFRVAADIARGLGWRRAERAARWHVTSRAHALLLLPRALVSRDGAAARILLVHAFGR